MLRRSLIVAAVIAVALLLDGCQAETPQPETPQPETPQPETLLERHGPGGDTAKPATWTFTAPGSWELRWSYSGCPDGLMWIDDVGETANPVHAFDRGGELDVFVRLPTVIQYQAGRSGSGVQPFDHGGSVRLGVDGHCRWQVVAVAV
jgi:hypothetical protein